MNNPVREIAEEQLAFIHNGKKIGRNAPCLCGSKKKFKLCCIKNIDRLNNLHNEKLQTPVDILEQK